MPKSKKSEIFDHVILKFTLGLIVVVFFIGVFFWLAGRFDWIAGWAYIGLLICGQGSSTAYLWRKTPDLLKRRGKLGKGTKNWDKFWLVIFGLLFLAILGISALDGGRYQWSTMPAWLWSIGAILYAFFVFVFTWAMDVNPFFEKTVRIQHEIGHRVVDSGPYKIVRHPGYTGMIIGLILTTPMLLGSFWAVVPAILAVVWTVFRTVLEDRTLRLELPGHEDYTQRVPYRLFPGIW